MDQNRDRDRDRGGDRGGGDRGGPHSHSHSNQNQSQSQNNQTPGLKIHIRGWPKQMKETDIRNVIQRFGYIHNFNVPHDFRRSENKGFCFVQYVDASITQLAMNELNGMTIPHPVIGGNGGCSTLRAELSHTNNSGSGAGGTTTATATTNSGGGGGSNNMHSTSNNSGGGGSGGSGRNN